MNNILKYQNPSSPLLIQRVNQSNANFVKRLLDPNRKSIPDWETKGQKIATHKMSWGEDDHGAYVFPEVQEIDGQLIDFSRPPYAPGIADYMAHKNNNSIRMSPEEADWFTRNYKQYYPSFKKGGSIHIKKKNRGKFTAAAKRAGMGVQEFARHVLSNKDKYSSTLVKRANFARNSKKFKHENGGILKAQEGTGNLLTPHPLSPVGIALNQAKAMAKMKGEQRHLPPGVKEVVGSDGKKIAIRTEQPLQPLEQSIAEWLPGTGDVAEVRQIANDIKKGNFGTAALAAGLMVLPGNARKILDKFGVDLGDINTFAKLSDQEWDDMYFQAIDSGDMGLVQTIRDAHFKIKAPNNKANFPVYTSSETAFNQFDLSHFGDTDTGFFGYGFYLTPYKKYADEYHPITRKFYVKTENPYTGDNAEFFNRLAHKEDKLNKRREELNSLLETNSLPEKTRAHYGISENDTIEEAKSKIAKGIEITKKKWASKYERFKEEFAGKDAVFSWRKFQGDLRYTNDELPVEVVIPKGENIKSADAITYDGNKIIPISKRDNFTINDIRFGIAPLILGLGVAKTISNNSNTKERL